ncbi:hypothetical protein BC830DRAFT_1092591 [Chytriomyces sp. MP71]|nr:hypothetical protein BC830DRAFT_1092591 [Chytriomyces sp. MP71]
MAPVVRHFNNQDYAKLFVQHARSRQRFLDDTFPPNDESLFGDALASMPLDCEVVWIRACELAQQPRLFAPGVASSVMPGALGNHWLVSAVAAMTIHPSLVARVVPDAIEQDWVNDVEARKRGNYYHGYHKSPDLHPSIFKFRFFQFGIWVEVVIDDYLPCTREGELVYARSRNPSEFWISLLEKAYAKLHGSYAAISSGSPASAFVDLSGNVPEQIDLRSEECMAEFLEPPSSSQGGNQANQPHAKLFQFLMKETRAKSMISCSIQPQTPASAVANETGLLYGHSYAIIDVVLVKIRMSNMRRRAVNLVKLRNPWGADAGGTFHGAWAAWSQEWQLVTKRELQRLQLVSDQDGSFFMSFQDFLKHFTTIIVCRQLDSFNLAGKSWQYFSQWSCAANTAGGSIRNPDTFPNNPQFLINIHEPTQIMISIIQNDVTLSPEHRGFVDSVSTLSKLPTLFKQSSNDTLVATPSLHLPSTIHGVKKPVLNSIGFTILRVEENRKYRVHKFNYEVTAIVPYVDSREIFSRILLDPGRYVLFPTTLDAGYDGDFVVRIVSCSDHTGAVTVTPLRKDRPTPPSGSMHLLDQLLKRAVSASSLASAHGMGWTAPIGVFRVEVVGCCSLRRVKLFAASGASAAGANPYCILKFVDMGGKPDALLQQSVPYTPPVPPPPPPPPKTTIEWVQALLTSGPMPAAPPSPPRPPLPANDPRSAIAAATNALLHRHTHSVLTTRVQKNTQNPVFEESFMWAVRRPREASLLIEVWSSRCLGGDLMLGSVAVKVEAFMESERADRAWEISMPIEKSSGSDDPSAAGRVELNHGTVLLRVKFESTIQFQRAFRFTIEGMVQLTQKRC